MPRGEAETKARLGLSALLQVVRAHDVDMCLLLAGVVTGTESEEQEGGFVLTRERRPTLGFHLHKC